MSGLAAVGGYERRVMAAMGGGSRTSEELATELGDAHADVRDALVRLVGAGLADADQGRVWLTDVGRMAVASEMVDPLGEVMDAARSMGSSWAARAEQASAERQAAADAILASDADRDRAVQQLAAAFSQGRLASTDLDERTGRALAARTRGELDDVLDGLGGLDLPASRHPVRTVLFWVATVLLSPFLLLGTLLLLFGTDVGDHVAGLVFLAVAGPPLFGLWRWSRRRR